ncbi:MAG: hypothetical protein QXH58_03260 [Nitrososphaerales archaeon]
MNEIQKTKFSLIINRKTEFVFMTSIALISLIYFLAQPIPILPGIIINIGAAVTTVVSLIVTIRATKKTYSSPIWRVFISLTIAISLFFIAEMIRNACFWFGSFNITYPSLANMVSITGYFPLAYALFTLLKLSPITRSSCAKFILFIVLGVIFLALAYVLLTPILSLGEGFNVLFFKLAYPIGDIFLFLFVLTLIIFIRKAWLSLIWLPLLISPIIELIAELSTVFAKASGTYFDGHPVGLLFTFSYALFAYGIHKAGDCMTTLKTYFSKDFNDFNSKMSLNDTFSKSLKLTHEELLGKRLLLEFDPRSKYEDAVEDLVKEALSHGESVIVFTQKGSNIHQRLSGQSRIHLILLVEGFITPKHTQKDELLIFSQDFWMMTETLKNMVRFEKICLIFDNLTNMILSIGFQKTCSFIQFVAELMAGSKAISLFLFNPKAHKATITYFIEGQFSEHLVHDQKGLKAIKISS